MEQRVTLITLGVRDLRRSHAFYGALGWRGQEAEETVFFQAGGLAVVLWSREKLAADCGLPDRAPGGAAGSGADSADSAAGAGFGGIALAHNVRSPAEVDAVLAAAEAAGAAVTRRAAETFYGGYAGVFTDPDGHAWEIAHNPGFALAEDGTLTLPDFGSR